MGCGGSKSTAAKPAAQPAAADKTLIAPAPEEAKPDTPAKPQAKKPNVIEMLSEVFHTCDGNADGTISREELAKAFDDLLQCSHRESGKTIKTLVMESGLNPYFNVFDQVDSNHDGKISLAEFREHLHPAKAGKVIGQLLKEVFDGIDVNKDGSLDRKELSDAYGTLLNTTEDKSGKSWKNLLLDAGLNPDFYVFEQLDSNDDGKVTWEEFISTLQPEPDMNKFLRRTFDKIDANSDGSISKEELRDNFEIVLDLGSPLAGKKTFRTMLQEAGINPKFCNFDKLDTNHDGKITWAEFESNLRPPAEQKVEETVEEKVEESGKKVEEAPADTGPEVVTEEVPKASPCC
jgi:Ca2+-binding EF-hand superfamily protein